MLEAAGSRIEPVEAVQRRHPEATVASLHDVAHEIGADALLPRRLVRVATLATLRIPVAQPLERAGPQLTLRIDVDRRHLLRPRVGSAPRVSHELHHRRPQIEQADAAAPRRHPQQPGVIHPERPHVAVRQPAGMPGIGRIAHHRIASRRHPRQARPERPHPQRSIRPLDDVGDNRVLQPGRGR